MNGVDPELAGIAGVLVILAAAVLMLRLIGDSDEPRPPAARTAGSPSRPAAHAPSGRADSAPATPAAFTPKVKGGFVLAPARRMSSAGANLRESLTEGSDITHADETDPALKALAVPGDLSEPVTVNGRAVALLAPQRRMIAVLARSPHSPQSPLALAEVMFSTVSALSDDKRVRQAGEDLAVRLQHAGAEDLVHRTSRGWQLAAPAAD